MGGRTTWSHDDDGRLRQMIGDGMLARQIGLFLGCTKNAVIGRAHRIGLVWGAKPVSDSAPRSKPVHNRTPPELLAARKSAQVSLAKRFEDERKTPLPTRTTGKGCTVFELDNWTCRWPIGDPGTASFYFCACVADNLAGRVYCDEHSRIAFNR